MTSNIYCYGRNLSSLSTRDLFKAIRKLVGNIQKAGKVSADNRSQLLAARCVLLYLAGALPAATYAATNAWLSEVADTIMPVCAFQATTGSSGNNFTRPSAAGQLTLYITDVRMITAEADVEKYLGQLEDSGMGAYYRSCLCVSANTA